MSRRALWLAVAPALVLALACGGKKDEDALLEEEGAPAAAPATAAASAPAAAPAAAPAPGVSVTGKVAFEGTAPTMERLKMDADAFCKAAHSSPVTSQEVVVNGNGTLRHVIVYVKEGVTGSFPPPTTPVVLDQHGCQYTPHTFGIQVGQPLKIVNSDGTLHNIHALPKKNAEFNIGQPFKGMETTKKFDNPEVGLRFKCDVHKWMSAWGLVSPHPFFAVTGEDGTFEIKNLPPGNYVIEAWHEKYGPMTQNVTVSATGAAVDFTFKG
jgi:plastocyanin